MYITQQQLRQLEQRIEEKSVTRDNDILKKINQVMREQHLAACKEIQAHLYQKATSYTNLIMLVGYAGLFGIWQMTRAFMNPTCTIWVGLLALISIALFISFEVYKSISSSCQMRSFQRVITANIPEKDRIKAWQKLTESSALKHYSVWIYFLIPILVTGFGSAVILMIEFVCVLLEGKLG